MKILIISHECVSKTRRLTKGARLESLISLASKRPNLRKRQCRRKDRRLL